MGNGREKHVVHGIDDTRHVTTVAGGTYVTRQPKPTANRRLTNDGVRILKASAFDSEVRWLAVAVPVINVASPKTTAKGRQWRRDSAVQGSADCGSVELWAEARLGRLSGGTCTKR